jgi:hypothetical protein
MTMRFVIDAGCPCLFHILWVTSINFVANSHAATALPPVHCCDLQPSDCVTLRACPRKTGALLTESFLE